MSEMESFSAEPLFFPPPAEFQATANLGPQEDALLRAAFDADYEGTWARLAKEELLWSKPFTKPFEGDFSGPKWFGDGELNASANCLDRWMGSATQHKAALVFEGEPGDVRTLTYAQLHSEVARTANVLRSLGVKKGDRVAIYMPLIPELVIAVLACARDDLIRKGVKRIRRHMQFVEYRALGRFDVTSQVRSLTKRRLMKLLISGATSSNKWPDK